MLLADTKTLDEVELSPRTSVAIYIYKAKRKTPSTAGWTAGLWSPQSVVDNQGHDLLGVEDAPAE